MKVFQNFITAYYKGSNIPNIFQLKNWSILLLIKLDFAPPEPQGKFDEDGEFWGDHILIPGF